MIAVGDSPQESQILFPVSIKATKAQMKVNQRCKIPKNRQELRPSLQIANSWKEQSQSKSQFMNLRPQNSNAFQSSSYGSMTTFAKMHRQQCLKPIHSVKEASRCNVHSFDILRVPLTERKPSQSESTLTPRETQEEEPQ